MIKSEGRVETGSASRYLQQLCKHFRHKTEVEFDSTRGRVDFPFGVCRLTADDAVLTMQCEAPDAEADARMRWVLSDHVERFAWREKAVVEWMPAAPATAAPGGESGAA